MKNTIDFKKIKIDRRNKDMPKSYLEAETIINEIKTEFHGFKWRAYVGPDIDCKFSFS